MKPTMLLASLFVLGIVFSKVHGDESSVQGPSLKVPDGFSIEIVAQPPLVQRPITAAFDEAGRLYVSDSSGSNDPVEKQLEERPHRIVRLEDIDGDGRFDQSTVFADRMMFPAGTLFYDGSLYVAAPPSIWKLTDTDDDGIADQREEWFKGKTLTGCANDLHGPYLGPDGFIYWCKGAFAEQTHNIQGQEWKSLAAHIFRSRADGSGLEVVMTGGMDNPVDVAFTPTGERIFSSTFLVHPSDGNRDGLAHAVYGGVFGKDHGVLEGHRRTGELMPILLHMGAAAPCGLECYDSNAWGDEYYGNLFACQFNLRKVSRHALRPEGGSFNIENHEFISSDSVDFHPTDVLVDADGSLLVVDTGGWYKLCCPTSQLWKPDMLGGIYRVRKNDSVRQDDPRGKQIAWDEVGFQELWMFLSDNRPVVRQRATTQLRRRRSSPQLQDFLSLLAEKPHAGVGESRSAALSRVWALAQIDNASSRSLNRSVLHHPDEQVRQAALQIISLHRDTESTSRLFDILAHDYPANQRLAAEALGRIGNLTAVSHLLNAAAKTSDRFLRHSIIYALIELQDAQATRNGLVHDDAKSVSAALIALDQMSDGGLQSTDVIPLLDSSDKTLSDAACWLIAHHAEWGGDLAGWFEDQLAAIPDTAPEIDESKANALESLLVGFTFDKSIQALMAASVTRPALSVPARSLVLRAMGRAQPQQVPDSWIDSITQIVADSKSDLLALAVSAVRQFPELDKPHQGLDAAMLLVADNKTLPRNTRVDALSIITSRLPELSDVQFEMLMNCSQGGDTVELRLAAAKALSAARLSKAQLMKLCERISKSGPLEINLLLGPFIHATDEPLGLELLAALRKADSLPAIRMDIVREKMANFGPGLRQGIEELHALINVDLESQRKRLAELLPKLADGDVRRGHAIFHSSKAACFACHQMGYAGGLVGPDLTRIGEIRTERDLLESIVFPSLSFVRSYEPVAVVLADGRTFNGVVRNDTSDEIRLATGPNQEARIARSEIEEIHPSTVSVMPAGLDKQLTTQELADLVAFLKNPTAK